MSDSSLRRRWSDKCHSAWRALHPEWRIIQQFKDERAYMSGGMWIHPCGQTYQEGGRDGFIEPHGKAHCDCALCAEFREEFC